MAEKVSIVGAGLAGSEAAWQIAKRGIHVDLYDMKPQKFSPAHKNADFAELVCSNSLRSDDYLHNAVGLMHEEMRRAGSLILKTADETKVPAGGALAVDRTLFARKITEAVQNHKNIRVIEEEITSLDDFEDGLAIIATGPLTSEKLAADILKHVQGETLSFYDAIAPVVYTESIDFSKAWYQSRYDKGDKKDYINCPMNKDEYEAFVSALLNAEKVAFKKNKKQPVGLTNPHHKDIKPYAVVQLRQDNTPDTLRNIVGFQTKLKYGEQERIFRTIPGLEHAEFARLGGIHKNTFIKSPLLLDSFLRFKSKPNVMFAGQITGCEGYVESAAVGLMAGVFASAFALGKTPALPKKTTAFGAMLGHLQDIQNIENYQPMNINFGLFEDTPPIITQNGKKRFLKGAEKKEAYAARALKDLDIWLKEI